MRLLTVRNARPFSAVAEGGHPCHFAAVAADEIVDGQESTNPSSARHPENLLKLRGFSPVSALVTTALRARSDEAGFVRGESPARFSPVWRLAPPRLPLRSSGARALRRYTHPGVLCIDEVGYLAYDNLDNRYADLLFEVVTRRYQNRSTILTTNKAFGEWTDVFPNAACVVTLIDRLVHRAEIIKITGEGYRLKEAKERATQKAKQRAARRRQKNAA